MDIFEDMKTWKDFDGPDTNTYNALVCGLVRHGYVREAIKYAQEALSVLRTSYDGRTLHASAVRQLCQGLVRANLADEFGASLRANLLTAGAPFQERWLAKDLGYRARLRPGSSECYQ